VGTNAMWVTVKADEGKESRSYKRCYNPNQNTKIHTYLLNERMRFYKLLGIIVRGDFSAG
jgi:hypothetical protein